MHIDFEKLLKYIGAAAAYALLLYVGSRIFDDAKFVGYFEPASGLLLAVLLIGGYRYSWGILICSILVHMILGSPFLQALVISSADLLQALISVWMINQNKKFDQRILTLSSYLRLILLGGCVGIAIGALIVNTIFLYLGWIDSIGYLRNMLKWWMSDTLGVMLIAPLILNWWWGKTNWRDSGSMIRLFLLLLLATLACAIIFLDLMSGTFVAGFAKGYWMFAVVTFAAVYFGIFETMLVLMLTAIFALMSAILGLGYFAHDIVGSHLVSYWFYVLILSLVGMTLSTYIAEQKRVLLEQRQFISMLTHELKTPISVLRMALSAMNIESKSMHHAETAIHDMNDLIERFQQVDQIEHEKIKILMQTCRMDEIIHELTDKLESNRFFVKAEPLPDLITDPQLLRIILGNLINNAIKYSPPETVVEICAKPQQHENKKGIQLTIQNLQGVAGLPDSKYIFKKYYRSPGAQRQTGSGLGMYLARSIAVMLGGDIVYDVNQEKVRFTLWMPY